MTEPRRLFLAGFSGTGKSAVASLVADTLGWRTVDTDRLIEEAAGRSVPEIFERDGEPRFRELERDAVRRAATEDDVVVATGGGAVIAQENRRAMADGGLLVCLEARPQAILERLREGEGTPDRNGPSSPGPTRSPASWS
ncbi:MAG: hypothetical protein A2148_03920 [Chloroflexi bacterium RBG_16_68_14]|nr:MAG: hypothetical protein A2148_03920 [Chloroflexi bacterium RBG_16_68_14]